MKTQTPRVLVFRTPQAEVRGNGGMYTPMRRRCSDPSGPMVAGLLRSAFTAAGMDAEVALIDTRSGLFGGVRERAYGTFRVPYIDEELTKYYHGISLDSVEDKLRNADIICFTSHFTGSSGIVKAHIREAKRLNPKAEIWVGGNEISTPDRQASYRAAGADRFWIGEVFSSLPAYIKERWGIEAPSPCSLELDAKKRGFYTLPVPAYIEDANYLRTFSDCAEGPYPDDEKFRPAVYTEFNKGCFHGCPFCTVPMTRRFFASMPPEEVQKHLEHYRRIGVKTLIMMDDNLLGPVLFWGNPKAGIQHVRSLMETINSYGFNVEFGNGLQLSVLIKYWDELSGPLFRNCFRFYMPVEDLASGNKKFGKLPQYEQELELFRKIAAGVGSLAQITIGIIIGGPDDDEEGLGKTIERMEEIKAVFRGSQIEMAFTPFMNKILPSTKNFEHYPRLTIHDIDAHPETYFFSLVSNVTSHISDPRIIWEAWLQMMGTNPAPDYLKRFRETGEVTLAKVI